MAELYLEEGAHAKAEDAACGLIQASGRPQLPPAAATHVNRCNLETRAKSVGSELGRNERYLGRGQY